MNSFISGQTEAVDSGGLPTKHKELNFTFGCCINSMSGERSMQEHANESFEFVKLLHAHVSPDVYMVQIWFKHPTTAEIFDSED